MSITRTAGRFLCFVMLAALLAPAVAQAYLVGFDTYSDEGVRLWVNTTGTGDASDAGRGVAHGGSADYESWAGLPGAGKEVSWSVDWHNEATPTRNIGTVLLYPGSRTVGEFKIWKGTWNGSSMDWVAVLDTTGNPPNPAVPKNHKPYVVNITSQHQSGWSALKYEIIAPGTLGDNSGSSCGMANIYLFPPATFSETVYLSPNAASQSSDSPYSARLITTELNKTFDGIAESVAGLNNDANQYHEAITYTFAATEHLRGVLVNINNQHDARYCWKTWEITDLNGTVLIGSEVGVNGDNSTATTCSRFQFLEFPTGPILTTGFIMRGKFGLISPPAELDHGNRMGEVWGVTAPPRRRWAPC